MTSDIFWADTLYVLRSPYLTEMNRRLCSRGGDPRSHGLFLLAGRFVHTRHRAVRVRGVGTETMPPPELLENKLRRSN